MPRDGPAAAISERTTDVLAGAIAGILGATTGTSGPPLLLAMSRHGLDRAQMRATLAWVFTLCGLTTLAWLELTGHVTPESRPLLPTSAPPLAVGTVLGSFLGKRLPDRAFATTIRLLLVGSGLACLTKAIAV